MWQNFLASEKGKVIAYFSRSPVYHWLMGYLFIPCMHFAVQPRTLLGHCETAPCWRPTSFYENILDGLSAADFLRGISRVSSLTAVGSWKIVLEWS